MNPGKIFIPFIISVSVITLTTATSYAFDKELKTQADQFRAEYSYNMAIEKYKRVLQDKTLVPKLQKEINFKLADCYWRSGVQNNFKKAEKILKELIESKDKDRWQAEANESLAEHYIQKDRWGHAELIKQYLSDARDFWAGETDIKLARQRFIRVSFTFGDFVTQNWGWYYTGLKPTRYSKTIAPRPENNNLGLNVLYEEILQVAKKDSDKAKATYSLARSYESYYHDKKVKKLTEEYFLKVIKSYSQTEWNDDAYYYLGQMYERVNDLTKAVDIYRRLESKFKKGESPWVDDAERKIKELTQPTITVSSGYTFLPQSEIRFNLRWRNMRQSKLTLYRINLVDALQLNEQKSLTDYDRGVDNYSKLLEYIVKTGQYHNYPKELAFNVTLKDEGKHLWHGDDKGLAEWQMKKGESHVDIEKGTLSPGAYLLLVEGGEKPAYDLILVTDVGLITKTAGHTALFFAFDSKTGSPRANTKVKYHYRYYDDRGHWMWEEAQGATDQDGLLNVVLKTSENRNYSNQHNLFAVVADGVMQAFSQGYYYNYHQEKGNWWLYAFSDKPAYRPNEEISFKGILRKYSGSSFSTPAGMKVKGLIKDARGNTIKEGIYNLNTYGTFHDVLKLDVKATLGEYRLEIWTQDMKSQLCYTSVFRLEEYKLPEFIVNITPKVAEENEDIPGFRLGDTVEVEVDAQYYFGGPVANAEVEYYVYQQQYYHTYQRERKYAWYYRNLTPEYYNHGNGQLIKKEKITTDDYGKAYFQFDTPKDIGYDLKFKIEARVVDQSRREIVNSSEIKVTQKAFYAYLTPKRNLYRPGDKAQVLIKTITANHAPVSVDGKVSVSRNWWTDPVTKRKEVVQPGQYRSDELFSKFIKTNENGEAVFDFEPEEDGYYTVSFTGYDENGEDITSSAFVYICSSQSKDIGYRYSGIQIIAEKDTYSIGEIAKFMIVAERPETWALWTSETGEIHDYSLIKMDGNIKLLEVPIKETFTPNIFFNIISVYEHQMRVSQIPVIVPPEEKFLNIKIISDKEVYQPREEGQFEIEVTDSNGEPVVGEVALGITDKSIYYIQPEYAKDIREFYYGDKRKLSVATQSSYQQRRYMRWVRGDENQLMTDEQKKAMALRKSEKDVTEGRRGDLDAVAALGDVGGYARDEFKEESGAGSKLYAEQSKSKRSRSNKLMAMNAPLAVMESEAVRKFDDGVMGRELQQGEELAEAELRTDFRSTVIWLPQVITDKEGKAKIKAVFPDSLTTWKTTARAITNQTMVGNVTHENRTKKDIIVRLQAPRFFTERDEVTLSANVHNYTDEDQKIKVSIDIQGGIKIDDEQSLWIEIPSGGEKRVDWSAKVLKKGNVDILVMAQTKVSSDAMKRNYPILPHGIEKFIANSIAIKGSSEKILTRSFTVDIPKERIKESTSLQLVLSPSLAAAMLDALPYLAKYPYGCVEQTMSRFLPTVVVAKTMKDLGLTSSQVNAYISDVMEPRNDPKGHPYRTNKVTVDKINQMTQAGLKRLYDFQHSDGGWGWWKEDDSNRFMTSYVVWGLSLTKKAGIDVKRSVINQAVAYLQDELVEEENNPDMLAWMLHALSEAGSSSQYEDKQTERLWVQRNDLNAYTRALFALSEYNRHNYERAEILARNMANGIDEDKDNSTAHWGKSGVHYRWSEGGVEATAFAVKALSLIDAQSSFLEPAVKWLALNRRGSRWKNTRDTAIAILGLADYLKTSNEINPNYRYEVFVNGTSIQGGEVSADNMFTFNRIILLDHEKLTDGRNEVQVTFEGNGALYVSGYLKYFTLEEDITSAGNEVFVRRRYFHKQEKESLMKGFVKEWKPFKDGDAIKSGQRVKVEIILDAKNHYEYLVVEDFKPAGFEAVELKSGTVHAQTIDDEGHETGGNVWSYREFRDERVAFFITKLPQGQHKITYELRAEVPGIFHGMPNQVHAMYVPEIRANSNEMRMTIEDK